MAPGPTPTFTMSAPASIRSTTPAADTTLPATTGTVGSISRTAASASIIRCWCPWAVSITSTSTPVASSRSALARTSPLTPSAAPIRSRPAPSTAGSYSVDRNAEVRVSTPTSRPSESTTGASLRCSSASRSNAWRAPASAGSVSNLVDITSESWANRSAPTQSRSVTTPTGRSWLTTTSAP